MRSPKVQRMTTEDAASYYIWTHFHARNVRPVVTHYYSPQEGGWVPTDARERLTPALAASYLRQGFVMVRARARLKTVEVILSNYLGKRASRAAS